MLASPPRRTLIITLKFWFLANLQPCYEFRRKRASHVCAEFRKDANNVIYQVLNTRPAEKQPGAICLAASIRNPENPRDIKLNKLGNAAKYRT